MNKAFWLLLLCILPCAVRADQTAIIFLIGGPGHDYHDLAIAGNYAQYPDKFPNDVNYIVGQSKPDQDWPYILPGPADSWAGNRQHKFTIHFQVGQPEFYV